MGDCTSQRPANPGFQLTLRAAGTRALLPGCRRSAPASRGLWASRVSRRPAPPQAFAPLLAARGVQGCSHAGRRKPGARWLRGARPPPTVAPECGPGPARRRRRRACARVRVAGSLEEAGAAIIPGPQVPIGSQLPSCGEIEQMRQQHHARKYL